MFAIQSVRLRHCSTSDPSVVFTRFNSFSRQDTYKQTDVFLACTLSSAFQVMLRSHLTVLESSAARYPTSPVFRIPQLDSNGTIDSWQTITYQRFHADVLSHARYWTSVFTRDRIPQRSVVGIWYVR